MRKILVALLTFGLFVSFIYAEGGKKYGKDISLKKAINISTILASPEKYEGQNVLIKGTVVNVCEKAGCWIELASDKEQQTIIVKVNDGEIVFPMEAKGKTALVEGKVFSVVVKEDACAGEGGTKKECNDSKVKKENCDKDKAAMSKKEKTTKRFMVKGIGAIIN